MGQGKKRVDIDVDDSSIKVRGLTVSRHGGPDLHIKVR